LRRSQTVNIYLELTIIAGMQYKLAYEYVELKREHSALSRMYMLIFVTYRFDLGHEFSILLLSQPQFMENLSYFLQKRKEGTPNDFTSGSVNYSTSYGLKS
jgi:hypothetical protein